MAAPSRSSCCCEPVRLHRSSPPGTSCVFPKEQRPEVSSPRMDSRATESEILENKLLDPSAVPISLPLYFLKSITHNFRNDQELGRGGYGVVYKGFLRCGIIIAVKKLFDIHLVEDNDRFQKELTLLMGIKHQNVVQLLGYCAESRWEMTKLSNGNYVLAQIPASLLCFEYLCNRGLDKHVSDESSGLEWNMRYEIIKGICNGLHFLHECNIVHLDLKPQNILLDDTMMPKIADFGLSRLLGEQKSRTVTLKIAGSFGYMAPEYINQGIISLKADIFSLGVIIIEILTGCRDYPQSIVHSFQHFYETNNPQSTETYFQPFTERVLRSWRNRFERASKYTAVEIHTQQVKQCIAIALKCVNPDLKKRPNTLDIIEILNAAERSCCVKNGKDSLVYHKEGVPPVDMQCEDGLGVVLNTSVRKDHTPARINEDTSKKEATGRAAACEEVHLELGVGNKNYQLERDASCTCNKVSGGPESNLLSGQPLQLNLTNNTDECVAFRLLTKNSSNEHFVGPLSGVVPPRCTLAVTMQNQPKRPCWRWLPSNKDRMLTTWVLAALRQWCFYMAAGLLAAASFGPEAILLILWSFFVCMTSPAWAWRWVLSQKHILAWAHTAACGSRERLAFLVDRHWPAVSQACTTSSRLALAALRQWRGCMARGVLAVASLGPAAVFVILWSFFVCMTSPAWALFALLSLGAAGAVVHYMGYTPGLFIVGLFGILIMWMYGYFWITGMLLVAGGCMCSLKHARYVIPILTTYDIYCVAVRVGWLGVFLTLNLSFLTNDLLNKLLQGYEGSTEEEKFEDTKDSDPVKDEFYRSCEFPPTPDSEPETVSDSSSLDEIKRIMDGSNHYEVLGIPRNRGIDQKSLKKEYHRMVLLVHPDKNMGNPLACESFKKLQSAYEVLSDFTKKNSYDEQLRKEESQKMTPRSRVVSQQSGVEFLSEESRRIQCTKCGNFHIWICTKRSKAKARFCQGCDQFHQAKDGDGWVEIETRFSTSLKMEIPRAFVCAESKIFDVSEWATCQGMECKPNTHGPTFMVNMVGADRMPQRSYSSRYPFSLDAEMIPEDEFELWLQQALASGVFADSP